MKKTLGLLAAIVIPICSTSAFAQSFTCPPSIAVDERPAAVEGFTAVPGDGPHAFRFVSFFDGDPKDLADLAPDTDEDKGDKIVETWQLVAVPGNRITVICRYDDTDATLQTLLPETIKSCTLVSLKGDASPATLTCK